MSSGEGAAEAWSWVPRGVPLDERSFRARHRVLNAVLVAHLPVLAVLAVVLDHAQGLEWA